MDPLHAVAGILVGYALMLILASIIIHIHHRKK